MSKFAEKKVLKSAEPAERLTDIQRLMNVINNRRDNKCAHPVGLPEHPQEAAQTWINFIEPRMKFEIDELRTKNDKSGWHLPYQERLVDCLEIYYKLSHTDQHYLQKLRSEGIYWRGDSIEFMKVREKVTPDSLKDKEKIRSTMRSIIKKIGA